MKRLNYLANTRVFGSLRLGRASCLKKCIAVAMIFFFEAPPPGYDVLWSAGVGAAIAPFACR